MSDDVEHLASLADPVRRQAYREVVERSGAGADRVEVATALGISRSLAAYHLDRLVDDGLLAARFEHRGVKPGPGSGRPSKVYERADVEVNVTLPPREYGLAAGIMADALDDLDRAARRKLTKAAAARGAALRAASGDSSDATLTEVLAPVGYEPYESDDGVRFRNCPFHALAQDHRDLVCAMNLALVRGLLHPEAAAGCSIELDPRDGECCVAIREAAT